MRQSRSLIVAKSQQIVGELGVFVKRPHRAGEILCIVRGPVRARPSRYSFCIGQGRHIEPTTTPSQPDFGRFTNHSCDPTAFARVAKDTLGVPYVEVVARKDLLAGDEVTFDYASLEYDVTVSGMKCQCGKASCRSIIHGFKDLPATIVRRYTIEGMIAQHLLVRQTDASGNKTASSARDSPSTSRPIP
ncbi:MAG: SET domain-containing protein-lysine N-methyltransferase [Nitrococcus sp.]|nr:SET domain-containing protein-lysine N-methyltransferase [Nitrococcus sp.]